MRMGIDKSLMLSYIEPQLCKLINLEQLAELIDLTLQMRLADERKKIINLAKRCLELAQHGDYSNGVEDESRSIDEGRVRAWELLESLEAELKELEVL